MESGKRSTRNEASERPTLAARQDELLERAAGRQRALFGAWVAATAIALVATVAMLESCGHDRRATRAASYPDGTTAEPQQNVVVSNEPQPGPGVGATAEPMVGTQEDLASVPPDAVATVSDTFVTAGEPIEVTVEATPDVTEMALSDGRGDALPMVRDSTGNVWRVHYRVPLRPRTDRLGLAVTAKNESNRWRRVWVFLQLDDGRLQAVPATPESGSVQQR